MSHTALHARLFAGLLAIACLAGSAAAQTAPEIDSLFPAGAQRGTRVEVQLSGKFMPGPCGLVVSGTGATTDSAKVSDRFTMTLAPDAPVTPLEVRIYSAQGGSAPFPFVVGDLPEIVYGASDEPLVLKLPVTVNGRFHPDGDLHQYALDLTAGRQVVCAATARAFRSPVDAALRLLDSAGRVVAESVAHRSADALLVYRASQAGRYILQVFDFQFARGPDQIYRLTVTDGPWLDYAFPAGVQAGAEREVTLYGWNLPGENGRQMPYRVPAGEAGLRDLLLPGCANRLTVVTGRAPESIETEPNDTPGQALQVAVPITVNGRIERPGDLDVYSFIAAKGDRFAIEVASADLQFPADPNLSISDEAGKRLVELDDSPPSRDPSLRFTAPADGRFFVTLSDHSDQGGEEFVYRLHIGPLRPEFSARVDVAAFAVHSGQSASLPVKIERTDGLDAELEVTAIDLPNGFSVQQQPVPKTPKSTVSLPLTAAAGLGPVSGPIRIVVRTTNVDPAQEREALIAVNPQATSGSRLLWLAVSPEVPFTLKTIATILEAPRLAAFPFPVDVERKEGFSGPIRLVGVEPDRRGTVVPLEGSIAEGSTRGRIPLIIQHGVTEGTTHRCRVMGVAEVPAADGTLCQVFHVATGNMLMGCQPGQLTMTVEPEVVRARPGDTVQVRVQLMRRVAMESVTLRVELPRGSSFLKSEPVTVTPDQNEATLTLNIASDASIPPRSTLTIQAESSRAGLPIYGQASFRLEQP